ncbi:MAG TPA: hypothetical protein VJJ47_03735 [Candidatus Paceibacterota bacterium]
MNHRKSFLIGFLCSAVLTGMMFYLNWAGERGFKREIAERYDAVDPELPPPELPTYYLQRDDERGLAVIWVLDSSPDLAVKSAAAAIEDWRRAPRAKSLDSAMVVVTLGYRPTPKKLPPKPAAP